MHKSDVNGENALPLYGYLKSQQGFQGFGKGPAALMMGAMLLISSIEPTVYIISAPAG